MVTRHAKHLQAVNSPRCVFFARHWEGHWTSPSFLRLVRRASAAAFSALRMSGGFVYAMMRVLFWSFSLARLAR